MSNFVVEIRWNRPWESRHGLFKIDEEERKKLIEAGLDVEYDYILVLKAFDREDLIEIVNSAGVPMKKYNSSIFALDDTTLALLLLYC